MVNVHELQELLAECPPDSEVLVDVANIPGIGEVYGAFLEDPEPVHIENYGVVSLRAVAP